MTVGIVETGAGNLTSVRAALDRLGHAHRTLAAPETDGVDVLVVPGQGHFGAVMDRLDRTGWRTALLDWHAAGRRLVGICVGHQILFEGSEEAPSARGLGLLAGRAARLDFPKAPMVGWAPVAFEGLPSGDAYFVNSFAVRDSEAATARVTYGEPFVAAARVGSAVGVQFHPEKSGAWGLGLLDRLVRGEDGSPSPVPRPPSPDSSLRKRVIPCLDVKDGRVVKGVNFVGLRDMGDPVDLAARYEAEGADEVVFLDIAASAENRATALDMVRRTAAALSIPFTLGGGLRTLDDVTAFLEAGADKVALNTQAVRTPDLVDACAAAFGRQCVVVAVDVLREDDGRYSVWTHGGRTATDLDGRAWAAELTERGAGEILLTCIHRDGTGDGFDTAITGELGRALPCQVIASGGAATPRHLADALAAGADAVLAATMFHSGAFSIGEAKRTIADAGIPVRLSSPAPPAL